ncbi:glutathione S-transferase family protein [Donghicola mangrovi]|uniref:Glutathione S-transferase family protein n=1 Tax=Donghicola mangrovi TaxID=2729614 RepID=A0A850QFK8_9RHOB|nr:glutathione S-transferase family protein [Donghicola mangrovi]NVO24889.1 glutathione S-transferase family protein [Donghicola mangrovi]
MIRLHHCPQTRSMRSLWLLHELGVDFEVVTHGFDKSLRSDSFLEMSPAGRVPALEIDGATMFETGAITEYLCDVYADSPMGRPAGHPERRDWLMWLHFAETLSQHSAALTQQHIMLYEDSMRSPIIMKLEAARLKKCYGGIEARLAGRDHLLDGGFSAADISVGQAVYMSRHFARLTGFPALEAWYGRISARPAFQASLPREGERLLYNEPFYPAWE